MPTYLITGASRGLGYGFIEHLSADPSNTIIGLVRNKSGTESKISSDTSLSNRTNIHIFEADITSHSSLVSARTEIEALLTKTNSSPQIDILIANAAAITVTTAFSKLTDFKDDIAALTNDLDLNYKTNVLGTIYTINVFLPLILKSSIKKVIAITTGFADNDLTNKYELYEAAPYSISKAGMNTAIAKYNAAHGKDSGDNVLFLAISPGVVATGNDGIPPPDSRLPQKFMTAYPNWTGPITPAQSVTYMMDVIDRADVNDENFAGRDVSHYGNREWL